MRRMGRASYALITFAVLVATGAATAFVLLRGNGPREAEAERIAAAARKLPYRPTEGRLVDLPFAPRERGTRGASDDDQRLHAASELAAGSGATPRTEAAAYLIIGKTDRAIERLEAATAAAPLDARVWADYAAARIEHGIRQNHAESFALAFAAADTALQIDRSLAEASFNRAVALEHLGLWPHAVDAYRRYALLDRDSEWRREADERQRRLRVPTARAVWTAALAHFRNGAHDLKRFLAIAEHHPQQARTWAEGECLVLWAGAFIAGREAEGDRYLSAARAIGEALARSGDPFVTDVVAAIDRAAAGTRGEIARGYAAYGAGRAAYAQRRVAEAAPHFDEAIARFGAGGQPMKLMAMYFRANVAFDQNDAARALALLDAADAAANDRYIAFRAQTRWQRGTIYGRIGRAYESLAAYVGAADDFASRNERENAARMRVYAAMLLSYLGRRTDAWSVRVAANREASISGSAELFESAINSAARAELREPRWELARSLFKLQLEPPNTNPPLHFDALLLFAYTGTRCTPPASTPDFDVLYDAAAAIPDAVLREHARNDAREAEAFVAAERHPTRALALLEETLAYRERNQQLTHISRTHTEIAALQRRHGRADQALEHLQRAIETRERQGAAVAREDLRDAFLHSDAAAYEAAVEILIERGRFAEAFDVAERMRARLLIERLRDERAARPLPAGDVQKQLMEDTTVLEIVTSAAATSLLIVSRDNVRGLTVQRDVRTLIDGPKAARELYDLLIAPAFRARPSTKTLVIVPSDAVDSVAFAALRAPDNRYVVELSTIVVPPSATTFLLARNARPEGKPGRSVFVADPRFDTALFPRLERLNGAQQEVRDLSRLYPGALVLTGDDATEQAVREAFPNAPTIHIAAHALTHRDDARYTVLPLAAGRQDGLLYLGEISSLHLRERPLVVLNGCQTGRSTEGAGSSRSLASAFLLAGARSVVATLWDVDDANARKLSIAFHERLTRGEPVASALRSAQLQMLRSPDPSLRDPRFWSAFQTFGADR